MRTPPSTSRSKSKRELEPVNALHAWRQGACIGKIGVGRVVRKDRCPDAIDGAIVHQNREWPSRGQSTSKRKGNPRR